MLNYLVFSCSYVKDFKLKNNFSSFELDFQPEFICRSKALHVKKQQRLSILAEMLVLL